MGIASEFREFAVKGNVVDMAVGVIIGGAFGKIVTSLVNDVVMPPVGLLMGGMNFKDLALELKPPVGVEGTPTYQPAVAIHYGAFVQSVTDFMIVAITIFVMVKVINSMRRKHEAEQAATKV